MKCKLNIISKGDGWSDKVSDIAAMEISEGRAEIFYRIDGDECALTVTENYLSQTRTGNLNVRISFREGQKTACIIGDNAMRGGYEINTLSLKATVKNTGCAATLVYLSGDDREKVTLTVCAVPSTSL